MPGFLLLGLASAAFAAPTLTVGSGSGAAGSSVNIPVNFDPTTSAVSGIQFSLTLPSGVSPGTVTAGAAANNAGKSVSSNLSGNTWTFIVFGLNQTSIGSGSLMTIQVMIAAGTPAGTLNLPISGISFVDANGNAIAGSGTDGSLSVTTLSCGQPGTNAFTGCYYNDMTLTNLVLTRTDNVINFDWGTGSPDPSVNVDGFSARWQGNFTFSAGTYNFTVTADDGIRLYVDNTLISDHWIDEGSTTYNAAMIMTAGTHLIKVEYYENAGNAVAQASWALAVSPPAITSALTMTATVGRSFSYQITATNSPTSFNATSLPAGLSINTGTGLISGTPSTAGTSNIGLSASNAGGPGNATLALTAYTACDLNRDGTTTVNDVQLEVNQAIGVAACTGDITMDGLCNVLDIQRIVNVLLGGQCVSP